MNELGIARDRLGNSPVDEHDDLSCYRLTRSTSHYHSFFSELARCGVKMLFYRFSESSFRGVASAFSNAQH